MHIAYEQGPVGVFKTTRGRRGRLDGSRKDAIDTCAPLVGVVVARLTGSDHLPGVLPGALHCEQGARLLGRLATAEVARALKFG